MPDGNADPHHFDFDLDRGIRQQVVEKLQSSPLLSLRRNIGPQSSGIYALYYKDVLVYIGKASRGTTKSKRTSAVSATVPRARARRNQIVV
jgi:hypothetical protein